ncbi:RDD family protein [Pseudonocardia sp. K10HN5]|uniref:RDD family protein n=1 Tax=Pseudonocardia acidicola TaxID=2724939 RepID=A0ABX1SAC2_9PSEU|nr:RDD family protein [Pseudonocardia acidicola]
MTVTPPHDPYAQPGPQPYGRPQYNQQPHPQPGPAGYGPPPYGQPGYPAPLPGYPAPPRGAFASWGARVGSALIDGLIPTAIAAILTIPISMSGDLGVTLIGSLLLFLAVLGFTIWNSGYRQGTTGQSVGKKIVGTRLVTAATGQPVGFGLAIGRQLAHILDGLPFYLGYLWPLWDERRQTFADKVCNTLVVRADG